jgi:protein TonB
MSGKPPQNVEAEAMGLPLEERARLAYRLLESMDTDLQGTAARSAAAGPADPRAEPAPGSPATGEVLGAGLVDDVVASILGRLAPVSLVPIPAPAPPTTAPSPATSILAPATSSPAPATPVDLEPTTPSIVAAGRTPAAAGDPIVDWESRLDLNAGTSELLPQPTIVGVGVTFPGWKSRRLVVSSLGVAAAALVTLGLVLQGREPATLDFAERLAAERAPAQRGPWKEIPTIAPSPEMRPEGRPALADSIPDETPRPRAAAVTREPARAPRRPAIEPPAIPSLPSAVIAVQTDLAPTDLRGPVILPPPPTPAPVADDLPVRLAMAGPGRVRAPGLAAPAAQPSLAPSTSSATSGSRGPAASPFDVAPRVSNPNRVQQALERAYPSSLRDWGIGGQAEMWFYVNEQGAVDSVQLRKTSGNKFLDQAALQAARAFEFTPGRRGNEPVAGWISLPIVFNGA